MVHTFKLSAMNKIIFIILFGWLWVVAALCCAILYLGMAFIGIFAVWLETLMTFIEKKYYAQFT